MNSVSILLLNYFQSILHVKAGCFAYFWKYGAICHYRDDYKVALAVFAARKLRILPVLFYQNSTYAQRAAAAFCWQVMFRYARYAQEMSGDRSLCQCRPSSTFGNKQRCHHWLLLLKVRGRLFLRAVAVENIHTYASLRSSILSLAVLPLGIRKLSAVQSLTSTITFPG